MPALVVGLLTATAAASFPLQPGSHGGHQLHAKGKSQSTAPVDYGFNADNCTFEDGKEDELTDFGFFGNEDRWPALYLLGVQKAATTSVATVLSHCGVIAFGASKETTSACGKVDMPCKELMHTSTSTHKLNTEEDQAAYTSQFNKDHCEDKEYKKLSCGTGEKSDPLYASDDCKSLRFQEDACARGRFLESTPLWSKQVTALLKYMPERLVAPSRFVAIFREPASRMLSWYNHMLANPYMFATGSSSSLKGKSKDSFSDFTAYELTRTHLEGAPFDMGKYIEMIEAFGNSSAKRSQLLVLNYDFVTSKASEAIHLITRHYGLPKVITEITSLPAVNNFDSDSKVVQMKCETQTKLHDFYGDYNQALYKRLQQDRKSGETASYEPEFGQFDIDDSAPCGGEEKTASALVRLHRKVPKDIDIA